MGRSQGGGGKRRLCDVKKEKRKKEEGRLHLGVCLERWNELKEKERERDPLAFDGGRFRGGRSLVWRCEFTTFPLLRMGIIVVAEIRRTLIWRRLIGQLLGWRCSISEPRAALKARSRQEEEREREKRVVFVFILL